MVLAVCYNAGARDCNSRGRQSDTFFSYGSPERYRFRHSMTSKKVTRPQNPELRALCEQLAKSSHSESEASLWPREQLDLCAESGVFEWFVPEAYGGQGWTAGEITEGYLLLSSACLTTTFILTQLTGACRRIAAASNEALPQRLLPALLEGKSIATLGISHLTTSRRHLKRPALHAEETDRGLILNGMSPWVTGGGEADHIVTGASLDDGRQLLAVIPTDLPGVAADEPTSLIALNGSRTTAVRFHHVEIDRSTLLCEPCENVMQSGVGGNTGGLQTSTLALGLTRRAIQFLREQTTARADLLEPTEQLEQESNALTERLRKLASEPRGAEAASQLRADANSLVLRSTQAALVAAKGAGFVATHPAGRWCREALFFLVWSCPQAVLQANLCELAGMD